MPQPILASGQTIAQMEGITFSMVLPMCHVHPDLLCIETVFEIPAGGNLNDKQESGIICIGGRSFFQGKPFLRKVVLILRNLTNQLTLGLFTLSTSSFW